MAAPDGIVWGSTVNSKGKIGIYTSTTSTATETTVSIQVWFYSRYSVTDNYNDYYFDNEKTAATTARGNVKISHTVNTSWSTKNQTMLGSYTDTFSRTTIDQTIYCAAKLKTIEAVDGTMTACTSYTIPALESYTISFNANSGTGAPSSLTKWHGVNVLIPSTKPTKTGHTFLGWSTSDQGDTVTHTPDHYFGIDADTTLYAVWQADTYTISFNANGGTGAPSSQTKTYGLDLTLSSTKPTRTNYTFLGWGVSANSTTVSYAAGGTFSANANTTLYAIWEVAYTEPRIRYVAVRRCDSDGTHNEEGTYFNISFLWDTDEDVTSIDITWTQYGTSTSQHSSITATGTSGEVNTILGSNDIATEYSYRIVIEVSDSKGSSTRTVTLPATTYTIDFLAGGNGVAIGKPATLTNTFNVRWYTQFDSSVYVGSMLRVAGSSSFGDVTVRDTAFIENASINTAKISTLTDTFDTDITNGLCKYLTDGIDPDTTIDHLILTHINTPNGGFMYIKTEFYSDKSETANRMQTAFPYSNQGSPYYRYYYNGSWVGWRQMKASNYTTSEVKTGDLWVDNKPLYRKTITTTSAGTGSDTAGYYVDIDISDLDFDYISVVRSTLKYNYSSNTNVYWCDMSTVNPTAGSPEYDFARAYIKDNTLRLHTGKNVKRILQYTTLEYTKTTD